MKDRIAALLQQHKADEVISLLEGYSPMDDTLYYLLGNAWRQKGNWQMAMNNYLEAAGINIKVSWMVFIINAILLILAWILIGKEFGAKTVYTALILGPLMDVWEAILPAQKLIDMRMANTQFTAVTQSVMGEPVLDLICFVLMLSISQAILFNINVLTRFQCCYKFLKRFLHILIGFFRKFNDSVSRIFRNPFGIHMEELKVSFKIIFISAIKVLRQAVPYLIILKGKHKSFSDKIIYCIAFIFFPFLL